MKPYGASVGEVAFYETIKTGEVRAILGKSDKGEGWRPVCRGYYLGGACEPTEARAISKGRAFMQDLKNRVEGKAAPISHIPAKPQRVRKKKETEK